MRYGHKNSLLLPITVATVLALGAVTLHADRDTERTALARVVAEIEQLDPLIAHAENESEVHDRVRFRYDWLRRDLDEVKSGIEAFLSDAEFTPRTFDPLQGEYHH